MWKNEGGKNDIKVQHSPLVPGNIFTEYRKNTKLNLQWKFFILDYNGNVP